MDKRFCLPVSTAEAIRRRKGWSYTTYKTAASGRSPSGYCCVTLTIFDGDDTEGVSVAPAELRIASKKQQLAQLKIKKAGYPAFFYSTIILRSRRVRSSCSITKTIRPRNDERPVTVCSSNSVENVTAINYIRLVLNQNILSK